MGELHPICTKCIKQTDFQKSVKLILPQPFFLLQYLNLETLWFAPHHHEFCCIFLRYHLLNIHFRIYNIEVRKKYKNILKLYGSAFDIKNGKLINCYQSYLSYYLLIFLIYHNNLLQNIFTVLDLIPSTLNEMVVLLQRGYLWNFAKVVYFISVSKGFTYQGNCIVTTLFHHNTNR